MQTAYEIHVLRWDYNVPHEDRDYYEDRIHGLTCGTYDACVTIIADRGADP